MNAVNGFYERHMAFVKLFGEAKVFCGDSVATKLKKQYKPIS